MAAGDYYPVHSTSGAQEVFSNIFAKLSAALGATTYKKATIPAGSSLSNVVDITGFRNIAIFMPDDWTAANLSFMVGISDGSPDQFANLYDSAGNEVVATASEDRVITDLPELAPVRWLRIRSGTNVASINQPSERELILILKG